MPSTATAIGSRRKRSGLTLTGGTLITPQDTAQKNFLWPSGKVGGRSKYRKPEVAVRKRYLVTGGCGFIGVNLIRRLVPVAGGIRIFDNLTTGRKEDLDGFDAEIVPGDIRDEAAVDRVVNGVDVVIHLAAHTRVIDSIQ